MRKFFKALSMLASLVCIVIFALVISADKKFPNKVYIAEKDSLNLGGVYTLKVNKNLKVSYTAKNLDNSKVSNEYKAEISLLNIIPVKSSDVIVTQRHYVIPGGDLFGIRLYTDGVLIVGMDDVTTKRETVNPAKEAGLQQGDVIKAVDGKKVIRNAEFSSAVKNCNGKSLELLILRDDKTIVVKFTPALSDVDDRYKAGLWVRDSSAGIGTITYYDREDMIFAGLGHAVCDVDTGEIMPLLDGDIVAASVNGSYKGSSGVTGELCGVFENKILGTLLINGPTGVYGTLNSIDSNKKEVPVAMSYEVKPGKAKIISTIDGDTPKYYDIKIIDINNNNSNEKNMTIEITDKELIKKTGGIVQGMSGSPIIQNGMLVGAVTHVFVNNPLQGYAIYAENMIKTSDKLDNRISKIAS